MSMQHRYLPVTDKEKQDMLAQIGIGSVDDLFACIPPAAGLGRRLNLPGPLSEPDLLRYFKKLADRNLHTGEYVSYLGAGVYDHFSPTAIDHILLRSEFYTAYTPYQPEVSQGTLRAVFEYQSMICALTGMDVSNASLYDGATGTAEAVIMACAQTRRSKVAISAAVHPAYRQVLNTYALAKNIEVVEIPFEQAMGITDLAVAEKFMAADCAAIIIQHPNFFGCLEDMEAAGRLAKDKGVLFIAVVDPVSLGLLRPPADFGADIVVGEGQALGINQSFGGPLLGFMAVTEKLQRRMPGRVVGRTVDNRGQTAYVLTLQTREQHIRRAQATSNICSNQGLNALAATIYLTLVGPQGLREVAEQSVRKAHYLAERLSAHGIHAVFKAPFFKEFVVRVGEDPAGLNKELLEHRILGGFGLGRDYPQLSQCQLLCVTERRTLRELDHYTAVMAEISRDKQGGDSRAEK